MSNIFIIASLVTVLTNCLSILLTSVFKDRQFDKRMALIEMRLDNIERNTSRHRDDYSQIG